MNTSLTDAIKEAFTVAPSNLTIYHTLQFFQLGGEGISIVQARQPITAKLETGAWQTFVPCGFKFALPPSSSEGFQSLNIAVDNINRQAIALIKGWIANQNAPVNVLYRPYISTDLTTPQMNPPLLLYMTDVSITATAINGTCTFMDVVNHKFPSELYTRTRFPSLQ